MTYTIHHEQTGNSFEVITMFDVQFDAVWRSVFTLFRPGSRVTISDELGGSAVFIKKGRSSTHAHH